MKLRNIWGHFKLITKHRWKVFQLSIKVGVPIRGLLHDLSKYSPAEFLEGAKYYTGKGSPISVARREKQMSEAWLHHRGHNKHHEEYWYDQYSPEKAPIIPYKYTIEMVCDNISAGMTYNAKNYNDSFELMYWTEKKNKDLFHPKMREFMQSVWEQLATEGLDKTVNKKNLKEKYERYCK